MKSTFAFFSLSLATGASAAPKLVCTAPKAQRKRVEALRAEKSADAFYAYAVKLGGDPTRCEGRAGKDPADSRLAFSWTDGSTLTFELLPPESGTRIYHSAKPLVDVAAVTRLLRTEVKGADWKTHEEYRDPKEPNLVTESYFVPDTNVRAVLVKRGKDVIGFGDGFAE